MSQLPPGWAATMLSEVAIPRGERVSPASHPDKQFIGLEHVEAHTTRILGSIPAAEVKSTVSLFEAGDVLYGRLRPYLNKVINPDFGGVASAEFIVFPDRPRLRSSFLKHRLNASDFVAFASRLNAGDRPRVDFDQIGRFPIALPPPNEQVRIAEKLDELLSDLDAGVGALERVRANLKHYRAAVLKAAVQGRLTEKWRAAHSNVESAEKLLERILAKRRRSWEEARLAEYAEKGQTPPRAWKNRYREPAKPDTASLPALPKRWCWAAIEQIAEVQGGIQKQPTRAPRSNSYPYLRVGNVLRNSLDLRRVERFELFPGELQRLRLKAGDLLIVEGNGSKSEIGRSALWRGEIENCVHQNHIIRVRMTLGAPEFLNIYWNSPPGSQRVMGQAASTSGLYTLSVGKVCALAVPVPPLDEQVAITAEVDARLSVIEHQSTSLAESVARASRLRQALLKRAFEGKLVPQNPNDEPASVVLEPIRAQREGKKNGPQNGRTKAPRRVLPA